MSSNTDTLRTTAFRITPVALGEVFLYHPSAAFRARWGQLEQTFRDGRPRWDPAARLPYASLAAALQIASGGFVRIDPGDLSGNVWMVSSQLLEMQRIVYTVMAWADLLPENLRGMLRVSEDDFHCESVAIADYVNVRPGRCPGAAGWVWEAGRWAVAARLATRPLESDDGPKPLRLDSQANLLAWQHPLVAADPRHSRAMHRIFPRLITVPGVEELVLHLNSSLSRLWTSGGGSSNMVG